MRQDLFVRRPALDIMRIGRIVAEFGVLDQVPDHVDAKAVDALLQPEPHHVVDRGAHVRIAPVEIRLLGQEGVIVILPGRLVELPRAAAELGQPVVRHAAIRLRIAPDVPVAFGIVARGAALDEPGMLVGGVVRHEVEDQLQAVVMRGREQRIEIRHRAEQRIDAGIVGDVVAEIGHRRGEDRRQPDRVDAERFHIRQPPQDAGEIADAVAIGVLKRARIDLIEDAVAPPILAALSHVGKPIQKLLLARENAEATPRFKPAGELGRPCDGGRGCSRPRHESFAWRHGKNRHCEPP